MYKISTNVFSKKIYAFFSVVFLTSFVIEQLTSIPINLTSVTMIILIVLQTILILKKRYLKVLSPDIILLIFMFYIFANEILRGTEMMVIISIIFGSFIPYFFGRMITNDVFSKIKKYWIILGIISVTVFLVTIDIFDFTTRGGNYNTAVIAMGETFGITALLLFIDYKERNKKYILFLMTSVVLVMLIYLGSRGAVFSLAIAILIYYKLRFYSARLNKKIKNMVILIILSIVVIALLNHFNVLGKVPLLNRFVISNIFKDVSIIGNENYLGRFDLLKNSIDVFKTSPLFGAGFGMVYSHNIIFEILSAYGLIGAILFILWITNIFSIKKMKTIPKQRIIWMIFSCLIFSLVYRMASFSLLAHKTLFFFAGTFITQFEDIKNLNFNKN